MTRHYTNVDLLAYIDRDDATVDLLAIAEHLAQCAGCAARLRDLTEFEEFVRSTIHTTDPDASWDMWPDFVDFLRTESMRQTRERAEAETTFHALMRRPIETWQTYLARHPDIQTEGLVRRLVEESIVELDRRADHALALLTHAATMLPFLPHNQAAYLEADIWKNRANALRMLGRYEEALAAVARAARVAEDSANGGFLFAQAVYTRGTILFKMGRYAEALGDAREAGFRFAEFGDARRVIHARNLEAVIHMEQGGVAEALAVYEIIRPHLEELGDVATAARVTANIAVSHLRLGDLAAARTYAIDAKERYAALGLDAEVIRAEWTLAAIALREGHTDDAIDLHYRVAAAFESRGMLADAGFVKLDLVEALLDRASWDEAAALARDTAETFAQSGAKLPLMRALAYLRETAERRTATPALVQYVRTYLAADDETATFQAPDGVS